VQCNETKNWRLNVVFLVRMFSFAVDVRTLRAAHQNTHVNVEFDGLSVTLGSKKILRSVYGSASAGQSLAVLGPSGTCTYIPGP